MSSLTRRSLLAGLATLPLVRNAQAGLVPYTLSRVGTSVGFSFFLSGIGQSGTMPIQSAEIQINPEQLEDSRVTVVMNVAAARTRLPFARGPMLSDSILNAQAFPTITFRSTQIQLGPTGRISEGATITGDLTLRGITRPVTLQANLYRKPGSATDDLNDLSIRLSGELDRHEFGASGYPALVSDTVALNIRAELMRKF